MELLPVQCISCHNDTFKLFFRVATGKLDMIICSKCNTVQEEEEN